MRGICPRRTRIWRHQLQILAQHLEQRTFGIGGDASELTVYGKSNGLFHITSRTPINQPIAKDRLIRYPVTEPMQT